MRVPFLIKQQIMITSFYDWRDTQTIDGHILPTDTRGTDAHWKKTLEFLKNKYKILY